MLGSESYSVRPPLPDNSLAEDQPLYIAELQHYLRAIPYENGESRLSGSDGIFGAETQQAVRLFQRDFGLPVTGTVDLATWNEIFGEYSRLQRLNTAALQILGFPDISARLTEGDSGNAVLFLQIMLFSLGRQYINLPRVNPNGIYDADTAQAVSIIQQISRLPADGAADLATWNAVAAAYNDFISTGR